jgi:hypothetical protein
MVKRRSDSHPMESLWDNRHVQAERAVRRLPRLVEEKRRQVPFEILVFAMPAARSHRHIDARAGGQGVATGGEVSGHSEGGATLRKLHAVSSTIDLQNRGWNGCRARLVPGLCEEASIGSAECGNDNIWIWSDPARARSVPVATSCSAGRFVRQVRNPIMMITAAELEEIIARTPANGSFMTAERSGRPTQLRKS